MEMLQNISLLPAICPSYFQNFRDQELACHISATSKLVHHIFKNTFHIFKTLFCYQQFVHHIFQTHFCYQQFVHHIFKHISVTNNLSSEVTKNCVIKKEVTIFCIGNCLLFGVCVTPAKVSPPPHYILPLTNRTKQDWTELWLVNRVKLFITSSPNCKSCK